MASFWGHYDVVQLLVSEGAKLNIKNRNSETALDIAGKYGYSKIAEYLSLQSGKKIPEMGVEKKQFEIFKKQQSPPLLEEEPSLQRKSKYKLTES